GPYIHLRQISDAFTNAGARATFFFNGNNYDCIYNPDRAADIQYAYNAGHQLGSHTWSHADLTTLNSDQITDGMYRVEEALAKIVGVLPGFMRPPYGSTNGNVQSISFSRNQNIALWDHDTGDANGASVPDSEAVYNSIVNSHLSNALVLEHETVDTTASTLVPYAINLFQSRGYQLVTMAQCVGASPYAQVGSPSQRDSSWTCNGTPAPGAACGGSIPCRSGTPPLGGGSKLTF
ncbi:carbohydrate esterase family 4 protein, partial [Marasmius fiardii PR-910]